jgi:hypothetical protein
MIKLIIYARDLEKHGLAAAKGPYPFGWQPNTQTSRGTLKPYSVAKMLETLATPNTVV